MLRAVQLLLHRDRRKRAPEALLDAWPTLPAVARAVAAAGAEVVVVVPAGRGARLVRDGVTYRFVEERTGLRRGPPGTRPVRRRPLRLTRAIADADPHVLHVHGLDLPDRVRFLRGRLPGVPILGQDHGSRPPSAARRALERLRPTPWDAAAFTARPQAVPFVEAGVLPPGLPVHEVLESSTDLTAGDPGARAGARRRTGLRGDPCILSLGRLAPVKDPLTVLDGLARAAPELPDAHLWCAYRSAPLFAQVEARVREDPRLRGRVHLLGERPPADVEDLLRSADVLVQGSLREGSGYAVLEAMACGVTPVVTDIPALRRIVGEAGELWPVGDADALAGALRAAAARTGPESRRAVRARFDAHLSWEALGRELLAAYRACREAGRREAGR